MKKIILLSLLLTSCSSYTPTYTKATQEQRNAGQFIPDDNYYNSPQFNQDMEDSAQIIFNLKQQLGYEKVNNLNN